MALMGLAAEPGVYRVHVPREARERMGLWSGFAPRTTGRVSSRHGNAHTRGVDVRELLHDGHPTACVAGTAFSYVKAFKAHVNVGFFRTHRTNEKIDIVRADIQTLPHRAFSSLKTRLVP